MDFNLPWFHTLNEYLFHDAFVTRRTTRGSTRHWGRALIPGAKHKSGAALDLEDQHLSNAQLREILENPQERGCLRRCIECEECPAHTARYDKSEIHEVELCGNNLTSFRESGLTDFVKHCRSLVSLCAYGCNFGLYQRNSPPTSLAVALDDIAQFARAIGSSNVHHLEIGGNQFGAAGLRTFLENLPPSRLKKLHLDTNNDNWSPEEPEVVKCITQFLSNPAKSRNISRFDFCYDFSYQARLYLLHIILGSYDAVNKDTYESAAMHAQMPNYSVYSFPLGIYLTDSRNNSIVFPKWMRLSRYWNADPEREIYKDIQRRNLQVCTVVRKEAISLLRITRILGCRVRVLGERQELFPFFKLPNELRIYILRMLAPHLDDTQFFNVLSWACCAATIGHCCRRRVDARSPMETTLDVPQWDWNKCTTCESHTISVPCEFPGMSCAVEALSFLESTGTNVASVDGWY